MAQMVQYDCVLFQILLEKPYTAAIKKCHEHQLTFNDPHLDATSLWLRFSLPIGSNPWF